MRLSQGGGKPGRQEERTRLTPHASRDPLTYLDHDPATAPPLEGQLGAAAAETRLAGASPRKEGDVEKVPIADTSDGMKHQSHRDAFAIGSLAYRSLREDLEGELPSFPDLQSESVIEENPLVDAWIVRSESLDGRAGCVFETCPGGDVGESPILKVRDVIRVGYGVREDLCEVPQQAGSILP